MIAKTFEVRDRATFIPILAVRLKPTTEQDRYLLARTGHGGKPEEQARYVMITELDGSMSRTGNENTAEFAWSSETMCTAHQYIVENFDNLESGAVIDTEFIRGESKVPKLSEAVDNV